MLLTRGLARVSLGVLAVTLCLGGCSMPPHVTPSPSSLQASQESSSARTTMSTLPKQAVVTGITTEVVADTTRVIVLTDIPVQYTTFAMPDPPRVAIDISPAVLGEISRPIAVAGDLVQRVEPLMPAKNTVRLILHLHRTAEHRVEVQERQLSLTLAETSRNPVVSSEPRHTETPPGFQDERSPRPLPRQAFATATMVQEVTFETRPEQSLVVIRTSGGRPQVRVRSRQNPMHLALDIANARLAPEQEGTLLVDDPEGLVTKLATTVSADEKSMVKIAVHLRERAPFEVQQEDGLIRLAFTKLLAPTTSVQTSSLPDSYPSVSAASVIAPVARTPAVVSPALPVALPAPRMVAQVAPAAAGSRAVTSQDAEATGSALDRPPRQYTGEKISLDFQDADIKDILRLIAEVSGLNIIAGGDVQGTVTTRMVDVPWDQALDVVLKINGLDQEREGNIIRVAPLERFTREQEERARALNAEKKAEPTVSRVIQVNYSAAADLRANLEKLLSERGTIFIDVRTNNLIVTDTQKHIAEVLTLVQKLDRPTPQVMIEARIVESSRSFMRELGIQIGLEHTQVTDQAFPSTIDISGGGTSGASAPGAISSPQGNFLLDLPAAVQTGAGGAIGFSLASIGGSLLDVQLSALEASGQGKVISSPRISTLDNTEALIQSGLRIPYETVSNEGTRTEFADASISLRVTPHVTPNDFIGMKLFATKNAPDFTRTSAGGVPTIITREATTEMLVKDGDTVVIGGLYSRDIDTNRSGIPFLSKIPVLGWLFQNTQESDNTDELLIFITPRIIRSPVEAPGKTRAIIY